MIVENWLILYSNILVCIQEYLSDQGVCIYTKGMANGAGC